MDISEGIQEVDNWLDSELPDEYKENELAQDWARIAKLVEEAGEVVNAFILMTKQNPRKVDYHADIEDVIKELCDCAFTAILAIQHFTKDTGETERFLWDRLVSLRERVPERYRIPDEEG